MKNLLWWNLPMLCSDIQLFAVFTNFFLILVRTILISIRLSNIVQMERYIYYCRSINNNGCQAKKIVWWLNRIRESCTSGKGSLQKGDGPTFSQISQTIFLLNQLGNGILMLFGGSCILLVLFLNPSVYHSLIVAPTNILSYQYKIHFGMDLGNYITFLIIDAEARKLVIFWKYSKHSSLFVNLEWTLSIWSGTKCQISSENNKMKRPTFHCCWLLVYSRTGSSFQWQIIWFLVRLGNFS